MQSQLKYQWHFLFKSWQGDFKIHHNKKWKRAKNNDKEQCWTRLALPDTKTYSETIIIKSVEKMCTISLAKNKFSYII